MYTAQQDMQFKDFQTRLLIVKINAGALTVQKKVGTNWVTANTITADGAYPMIFGNSPVRFIPTGGCQFEVEQ